MESNDNQMISQGETIRPGKGEDIDAVGNDDNWEEKRIG